MNQIKRSKIRNIASSICFCLVMVGFTYAQSDLYSSTQFQQWSQWFMKQEHEKLLTSVEKNLLSDAPHPMASMTWLKTHEALGDLDIAYGKLNTRLRDKLSTIVDIYRTNGVELPQKYPLNKVLKTYNWSELYQLILTKNENVDSDYTYQLAKYALSRYPKSFIAIWSVMASILYNPTVREQFMKDYLRDGFKHSPKFKQNYELYTGKLPLSDYDALVAVEAFLDDNPHDATAWRYKGIKHYDLEQYDKAIDAYKKAFSFDPILRNGFWSLYGIAKSKAKLQKFKEVEELATQLAALYKKSDSKAYKYVYWAQVLRETGDRGQARKVLKEAAVIFPEHQAICYEWGLLEDIDKRYKYAIPHLRKAVKADKDNFSYQLALIKAYKNTGNTNMALEQFRTVLSRQNILDEGLYSLGSEIYVDFEEYEAATALLKKAIEYYPHSDWMRRELAVIYQNVKSAEKGITALTNSFKYYKPYYWSIHKLTDFLKIKNKGNKEKVISVLRELAEKFYWEETIWQKIAELSESDEEKIVIWQEAIEKNPGRIFPYLNIREIYLKKEAWDKIADMYANATEQILKFGREMDKINLNFEKAIYIVGKLRTAHISNEEWKWAVNYFDKYLDQGGRAGAYYQFMAELYEAKGDKKKAGNLFAKQFDYRPDNNPLELITRYQKYAAGFQKLKRYAERAPYDKDRLYSLIDMHVKYGGSPIAAIIYNQQYKERFGESIDYQSAMAYGQLGDNAKDFEIRYQKENSIAPSFRYLNWYNHSRQRAWKGSAEVNIDAKKREATITLPNGVVVKRQDDITLGRIKRIQIGPVYVKADYDDNGNLTLLESSSGRRIKLVYNEDENISQITNREKGQTVEIVDLKYNDMGKPILIAVKGEGAINVTYSDSGEIDEITSDQGQSIAVKVSQAFQSLISLTESFETINFVTNLKMPDLGVADHVYQKLKDEYDNQSNVIAFEEDLKEKMIITWMDKGLEFCRYMYQNISADEDYGTTILEITAQIIKKKANTSTLRERDKVLSAIRLYHDTLDKLRYLGVDEGTWEEWIEICDWLELQKNAQIKLTNYRKGIETLQKYIAENPITLLADASWLPKSFLQNTGFWKKYGYADLVPKHLQENLRLHCTFYRANGDMLLGTNKGLSILRKGYWEWMGFNDFKKAFEPDLAMSKLKGTSEITCFAETSGSSLYIGTSNGLLVMEKNYAVKIREKYTDLNGLPSNNITHLQAINNKVLIGTSKGIVYLQKGKIFPVPGIQGTTTKLLKTKIYNDSISSQTVILVGTENGLFLASVDEEKTSPVFTRIQSQTGTDCTLGADGYVYMLKDKELYRLVPQQNKLYIPLKLSGTIITTQANKIYGLTSLPVNATEEALTVMTDYGLLIYHKKHFEHFRLPFDHNAWAKGISRASNANNMSILTDDGILSFQYENMKKWPGKIHDILTVDALGMTFVTDGHRLKYVLHNDNRGEVRGVEDYSYYSTTTHLAVDDQHRIILNDGLKIYRFTFDPKTKKLLQKEELFYCKQTEVEGYTSSDVTSILVASDDTIWVTAGLSLFRYQDATAEAQEYNFFRAPELFPSRTYHIDRVIETIDQRILVVCSNEGHLSYHGIFLIGGLLEWLPEEEKFIRTTEDLKERGFHFFITGYTPISDELAIVGTLDGFAEDRQGYIRDYSEIGGGIKNLSYNAIYKERRSLFAGTKGAKLGNLWLFGCASGILVFQDGMWFYPERFNKMLPDDLELGKYGSRHVNAIATDRNGKIYIGTDRGLAIYDSDGADPMSFLIHNLDPNNAFLHQNMNILQEERDAILTSIPADSETGKILHKIDEEAKKIKEIKRKIAINQQVKLRGPGPGGSPKKIKSTINSLTVVMEDIQQRHANLLLTLQQKEPSVHQLLTLPPLDLVASRKRMKENEAIIQYIPAERSLFIQVLAKDKILMKEIKISRKILMDSCKDVHDLLAQDTSASGNTNENAIRVKMCFLYDHLLRPICEEIKGYENIYVVPTKSLYYIPFAALAKKTSSKQYKYAVEEFNIGYVSSMYLFNLIYNCKPSTSKNTLLMGDPDGSIPSAREELEAIEKGEMMSCSFSKFVGHEASTKNFKSNAINSRIIHLATHGSLNKKSVKDSYLLFADKEMTMSEIFSLSLDNTELVTLSACQTGLGGNGMEYATLARAFTAAGTPTVLATLWEVETKSAKELIVKFYQYYAQCKNKFIALGKAQCDLIGHENTDFNRIARWSPFILIGKH